MISKQMLMIGMYMKRTSTFCDLHTVSSRMCIHAGLLFNWSTASYLHRICNF